MRQLQLGIMYGIAQGESLEVLGVGETSGNVAVGGVESAMPAEMGTPEVTALNTTTKTTTRTTTTRTTTTRTTTTTTQTSPTATRTSTIPRNTGRASPPTPPSPPPQPLLTETTKLSKKDYSAVLVQEFPSSNSLPAFEYKEYVPKLFKLLRESFGVDSADYLVSITGGPALRELPSPGASGCIFFLSEDDRFFIKSVRKDEMGIVLQFMKHYQRHVCRNPTTLLVKFFGIHRVSPWFGRGLGNARFVVMGNVLTTEKRMHRKFDLKGSTYKRTIGKERLQDPNATLKDLDIDMRFLLSPRTYQKVMETMQQDVSFLADRNLIDYSLLLGVHVIAWGEHQWYPPGEGFQIGEVDGEHSESARSLDKNRYQSLAFSRNLVQHVDSLELLESEDSEMVRNAASLIASANSVRDAARTSAASATLMQFSQSSSAWQSSASMVPERGHDVGFDESSIGWAMPAIAVQKESGEKTPVLLYFGIIDFLQKFNTRKRLEKWWKTTLHGPTVSVADPKRYAHRFMESMKGIFVDIEQCGDAEGMEYVLNVK